MKFVDITDIHVIGGHGGPGAVSFRREKYVPKGGPDGGDGGDGGHVILTASTQLQTLMDLKVKRFYKGKSGEPGGGRQKSGASGKNVIIKVPCGTMIYDEHNTLLADLAEDGQTFMAAEGGKGGRGNVRFSTSVNQTPRYAQKGLPGEDRSLKLELRILAEVGLIGLPNAGKSTLLSVLTDASPKIGNYPFTTLYPNLGVLKFVDQELVIADIPGLIEGASQGVGLGHEFLRHVDRTNLLVHLVSAEAINPKQCLENFDIITKELEDSRASLLEKPVIVVINKIDIVSDAELSKIISEFSARGIRAIPISAATREGLSDFIQRLQKEWQHATKDSK